MSQRKIFGIIKSVRGTYGWGRKTSDTFEISIRDTVGTCGRLYQSHLPGLCSTPSGLTIMYLS